MILCQLELEILSKLDFHGGHFSKWPKPIVRPNFFSGTIANSPNSFFYCLSHRNIATYVFLRFGTKKPISF